ncbi:MAG: CBS domain-containing protein [Phycisphaerales bacterium]
MGVQDVQATMTSDERSRFMRSLLRDVQALEHQLLAGAFETGIVRIGAEQEMVMVDRDWQPAPVAMELLEDLTDERITTEIARFNLEGNLTPQRLTGGCLQTLERELHDVIQIVRAACRRHGAEVVLTGILPTLAKSDLERDSISDRPRYFALNDALSALRGGAYELSIEGLDEVQIEHDTIMLEALNTSFQLHYQVEPESFAPLYNLAQAITGPLLAVAANSPILFGKRLWRETRIAIFQQTVDTRFDAPAERDVLARVRFGEQWVNESPMELFKEDIARFRVILGRGGCEDPFEAMEAGRVPALEALQLHNSTVYRWNRPCYGITRSPDGDRPHLRIENRVLPAGPTVLDEVANAALWFGLMHGGREAYGDVRTKLDFDDARANFSVCARQGMNSELNWMNGAYLSARELVLNELLPVAEAGLRSAGVDSSDIDRYLGVIRDRTESRRTGAQWLLRSVAEMQGRGTRAERLAALVSGTHRRQHPSGDSDGAPDAATVTPVHEWTSAGLEEAGGWTRNFQRVEQYMTRELLTVHDDDTIDLVVTLMDWKHVRHVPVEDAAHNLVGVVSYRMLLHHLAKSIATGRAKQSAEPAKGASRDEHDSYSIPVHSIMRRDPVTVGPRTSTLEAIAIMREHAVSCLPVTKDGRLVGLVTEHDFMDIAGQLLEERLRSPD